MKQKFLNIKFILASLSAVAAICVVAVIIMFVTKDNEGYRTIKVIETSGEVDVIKGDKEYSAYVGMVLEEGYQLETAANSYIRLILDDDKYVKVEAGSKVIFESLGKQGSNKTKIRIESGAMTCEIVNPLEGEDDFTVNTPNAVLAVRGTFFRVDLNFYEDDLVKTHVVTYGGKVATQRVLSTGTLVGEEVDVDAGNKVIISQISEVEDDGNVIEDVVYETSTITVDDIPDDDLIDVFFAIENGHDMFVDIDTVKDVLESREIDIEEHTSVYEKAKNVIESNTNDSSGDSSSNEESTTEEPTTEEPTTEEPTTEEPTTEKPTTEEPTTEEPTTEKPTTEEPTTEEPTTEEPTTEEATTEESTTEESTTEHTHSYEGNETLEATCTSKGEMTYTCNCGDTYTEEIDYLDHVSVDAGEANVHTKCGVCGEVLEDGTYHSYEGNETLASTCTSKGEMTYICSCGHTYTEEIDYLDHVSVDAGEENVHKKCGMCGEPMENGSCHDYTTETTKQPSCSEFGILAHTCGCGYSYTEDIPKEDHTEVAGAQAGVHKKCGVCGAVIQDSTYHNYLEEETIAPTCTTKGTMTYTCDCGHEYTEDIEPLGHKKSDESAGSTTCINCGMPWVDISQSNFEDEALRDKLSEFDTDGDGYLIGAELTGITEVSVAGTADEDGGCKNLSGIELLPNVTAINCSYNADLLTIDLSGNTKMYRLVCNNTGVESINVSGCTNLYELNFKNCSSLTTLDISGTPTTSLAISSNPQLDTLNISDSDVRTLTISGANFTTFEINGLQNLTYFSVSDTPIQSVTISDSYIGGQVILEGLTKLESVVVTNSTIDDINVDNCVALKTLSIPDTNAAVSYENISQVETLNLRGTKIYSLELPGYIYTALTALDVSGCDSLQSINVSGCTSLTDLIVTDNPTLSSINASSSGISSIDLTGCTYLGELNLNSTQIEDMGDVIVPADGNIYSLNIGSQAEYDINLSFDAEDISWFSTLMVLDLTNAKISDTDWATIKSALSPNNIGSLKLSGNNSTNSGYGGDYIMKLDLSGFTNLHMLEVEGLTDVTEIDISDASIGEMDFSGFTDLIILNAAGSSLMNLNLTSNYLLEEIDVSNCTSLSSIVMNDYMNTYALYSLNVTGCSALENIILNSCNNLTSIDVSGATNLIFLGLNSCTGLTAIDVSGMSSLTELRLEMCSNLQTVNLSNTSVETLSLLVCGAINSVDVTGITNSNNAIEVDITGTTIDESIFTKSDGFTINLVTQ